VHDGEAGLFILARAVIVGSGGPKFEKREIREVAVMAKLCPVLSTVRIEGEMDMDEAILAWSAAAKESLPIRKRESLLSNNRISISKLTYRITCVRDRIL
jgi:hypothetical protein